MPLSAIGEQAISDLFRMIDTNNDGFIDSKEQHHATKKLHSMTMPKGRWTWADKDLDGDGKISVSEWLAAMQAIADGQQTIAKCECCMLPAVMLEEAVRLRGRDVIWYVDSTAALSGPVRGTSKEPVDRKLIALFWMLVFRADARVWLEYVDSGGNWSDGISSDFGKDPLAAEFCFSTCEFAFQPRWMRYDYQELWSKTKEISPPPLTGVV